jgi:hypothetical protein
LLSCALAGLAAAALASALCGFALGCLVGFTANPTSLATRISGAAWSVGLCTLVGTVVGAAPAILVLYLSPAKLAPWRSVPVLAGGAALGLVVIGLPWSLFPATEYVPWLTVGMPVVGAIAGGAFSTRFLARGSQLGPVLPVAAIAGFVLGLVAGVTLLAFAIGAFLRKYGAYVSAPTVPRALLILGFIAYVVIGSAAFAAVIRRIGWNERPLVKGVAVGTVAAAFIIGGFASFAIPGS